MNLRGALAMCAAILATAICAHQRHFVLDVRSPASFALMLTHRCGRVFAMAMSWALAEGLIALARTQHRLPVTSERWRVPSSARRS